jgi:hypothetical protein
MYICIHLYLNAAISNGTRKTEAQVIFVDLFITQVFRLSVCLRRNKWKLPVFKRTKRICPSMIIITYSKQPIGNQVLFFHQ